MNSTESHRVWQSLILDPFIPNVVLLQHLWSLPPSLLLPLSTIYVYVFEIYTYRQRKYKFWRGCAAWVPGSWWWEPGWCFSAGRTLWWISRLVSHACKAQVLTCSWTYSLELKEAELDSQHRSPEILWLNNIGNIHDFVSKIPQVYPSL